LRRKGFKGISDVPLRARESCLVPSADKLPPIVTINSFPSMAFAKQAATSTARSGPEDPSVATNMHCILHLTYKGVEFDLVGIATTPPRIRGSMIWRKNCQASRC
jgi:hypothetical protein